MKKTEIINILTKNLRDGVEYTMITLDHGRLTKEIDHSADGEIANVEAAPAVEAVAPVVEAAPIVETVAPVVEAAPVVDTIEPVVAEAPVQNVEAVITETATVIDQFEDFNGAVPAPAQTAEQAAAEFNAAPAQPAQPAPAPVQEVVAPAPAPAVAPAPAANAGLGLDGFDSDFDSL